MQKITHETIKKLSDYEGKPVLTLYVPTHRFPTPPNIQEDQTRFKNLVRAGFEQWREALKDTPVDHIQQELEGRLDDLTFWQETIETLAIFARPDGVELYHLPVECEERVYVGEQFDVTPLLLVEAMNQPCYVFTLAMHEPKLYRADMYGLELLAVDFPKSPEDALNIDEMFSGSNTVRNGRQRGANSVASSPHGQGDANEAGREERFMYLRILDDMIRSMKDFDASLPVVIAATDTEFGDFRTVSQLNITDVHIPGNHTTTSPNELHKLVSELMFDHKHAERQAAELERLGEMTGARKTSADLAELTPAAHEGRIDTLLVAMVDLTTDSVADNDRPKPLIRYLKRFDRALFDLICKTLASGGRIIGVEPGSLPNLSPVAAIYRY